MVGRSNLQCFIYETLRTNFTFFRFEKRGYSDRNWGGCLTNDEIILGNFKGNDSLPLANRGNTFVSLRGVLEILSKTELSSDIVDKMYDEDDTFLADYRIE